MKNSRSDPEEIIRLGVAVASLIALALSWPALAVVIRAWKRPASFRLMRVRTLIIRGLFFILCGVGLWYYWNIRPLMGHPGVASPLLYKGHSHGLHPHLHKGLPIHASQWVALAEGIIPLWLMGVGLAVTLSPLIARMRRPKNYVTTRDLWVQVPHFDQVRKAFDNKYLMPLGIDLRTGRVLSLAQRRRTSHVITLGATGTGKTILLVNSVLHAIRHGQPCVVIDPKGEDSTLELVTEIGKHLSPDFESKLRVFKLSRPEQSCTYNPLKHGNANQLKDRILEALNWSEQYYQALAGEFLTLFAAAYEKLGLTLDLATVALVLSEKTEQARLLKRLKEGLSDSDLAGQMLYRRMSALMERMKADDLLGLHAQLSILNSPAMSVLLSGDSKNKWGEIDLRQVLAKNQIAYFQLDTLGNPDTARRLGRIIIEDLKGLASHIYKNVPDENHRRFFPVFIDEFGSFASKEFIEGLKQMRGSKIAFHLFTQGFEDLDAISPEFRRQAASNPLTKIGMRLDDNETVNELCAMAGTVECFEQSYQVEGQFVQNKTGMGNLRESRKMRVEHDVFKNLNVGQAVIIEKSPSRVSPIQVFHPGILVSP